MADGSCKESCCYHLGHLYNPGQLKVFLAARKELMLIACFCNVPRSSESIFPQFNTTISSLQGKTKYL